MLYGDGMDGKQNVDNESTNTTSTTRRPTAVVVNAPTLSEGIFELFRITRAIDRTYDPGLTVPSSCRQIAPHTSAYTGRGYRLQGHASTCGIRVVRGSKADPYLVSAYPDPDVAVDDIVTEYLR